MYTCAMYTTCIKHQSVNKNDLQVVISLYLILNMLKLFLNMLNLVIQENDDHLILIPLQLPWIDACGIQLCLACLYKKH